MQEVIDKNPKEAAPGGNPEIDARVKGYVAVVLRSQEKIDTYKPQVSQGRMSNADGRHSMDNTSTLRCTTYSELVTQTQWRKSLTPTRPI
jgi:hypothetical protein